MKWYKFRAFTLLFLIKWLSKLLRVEAVPIPSVAAMIKKEDKLLFVNLSYLKGYGFPGGIIQAGESADAALAREVKEETGLEVISARYLFSSASRFRGVATLSFIFEVEAHGEPQASREGGLVWLEPREALDKLAYPNNRPTLERYIEKYF